jgi:acyl-CoA thioester hydrolase
MGVVYHTHYLVWCEIGRTDFIRQFGVRYADLERQGLFLAVAEARIRYVGAARYDDPIRVDTWIEAVQSRALTFGYAIARTGGEDAKLLARATTKLIALDAHGATRALPSELLERFRATLAVDPA